MGVRALVAVILLALLALAPPALAARPDDLSRDPLDRAALLALPSVYRVEVVVHVRGLRLKDGTVLAMPGTSGVFEEVGTAFAAAPGGWLVSAAHVAAPNPQRIALLAYQSRERVQGRQVTEVAAREWVERNGALPVAGRVVSRRVSQADAGGGHLRSSTYMPVEVRPSDSADLVALRIDAPGAPALRLDEAATVGTPVVTIGFGRGSSLDGPRPGDLEPEVRRGELGRTGTLEGDGDGPEREAMVITVPVEPGDSGAPVVDEDGRVRGVVVIRDADGGVAERATEVRQLLASIGVAPGEGAAAARFRTAMQDFWRFDFAGAQRGFAGTLAAFGGHTLAGVERSRAQELAAADYRLEGVRRPQRTLLALGIVAAVAALVCAIALGRLTLGRGGPR